MAVKLNKTKGVVGAGNGAKDLIQVSGPYRVQATLRGTADFLYHRFDCDQVEGAGKGAKGGVGKKKDNLESYVYRNEKGELCVPAEHLRMAMKIAAKSRSDPRSPRKSAMDLFDSTVIMDFPLATLGKKKWDYDHKCRAVIQRASIIRVRPAICAGWEVSFNMTVLAGDYIHPDLLQEVMVDAGRFQGLGDHRPTHGRFAVIKFEVLKQ